MNHHYTRRNFLKTTGIVGAGIGLAGLERPGLVAARPVPKIELGWRLGIQTYTFRQFTLFEAIDKTASVGLSHIEAIYFKDVSKNHKLKLGPGLSADVMKDIKNKLNDSGVKMTGYFAERNSFDSKLFDFCKELGVEMIVSEPAIEELDDIEKLCDEFKIDLALANHPKGGSAYWHPKNVMQACKGRSKRIGASGDIRHWGYEGLNALECVRMLEGRLLAFHFRDMSMATGKGLKDVPIGTGKSNIQGVLAEVLRQGATPNFMIEYVNDFNMQKLMQSINFYKKTVDELTATVSQA